MSMFSEKKTRIVVVLQFCHVHWIILHSSGELLIQMICKNIYVHEKNFNFLPLLFRIVVPWCASTP